MTRKQERKRLSRANVTVSRGQDGKTKLLLNGQNISKYVTRFWIEQSGGDPWPTVTIEIPASVDFCSQVCAEIERVR